MTEDRSSSPRRDSAVNPMRGAVVVGVIEGQSPAVLAAALRTAQDLHSPLLLVHVAPDPYLLGDYDVGTGSIPVSSGMLLAEVAAMRKDPVFPVELAASVEVVLRDATIPWSTRVATGEAALALGEVADDVDARMIVVGTRENGVLASIAEFLSGSVAVHLAHRQHRPVLVVPLPERNPDRTAPWDVAE